MKQRKIIELQPEQRMQKEDRATSIAKLGWLVATSSVDSRMCLSIFEHMVDEGEITREDLLLMRLRANQAAVGFEAIARTITTALGEQE